MNMNRRSFIGAGALAAVAGFSKDAKCDDKRTGAVLASKPIGGERSHFQGDDPRMPGFTEKVFGKKPFKVLFVGAHPDDADFQCGSLARKVKRAGGEVVFVSCCNGNKGHQWMASDELAARRYKETQAAAKVLGIDKYIVLKYNDCCIEATMEFRDTITRLIRSEAPNLLITHRTSDYHSDHRAVGMGVRDATYLFGVPLYCPDTPVPEILPFVMYAGDRFKEPAPFRPDMMVSVDDELDTLLEAWACHESQEFEWLPPEYGYKVSEIPKDHAARIAFLRDKMMPGRPRANGRQHRKALDAAWGGKGPRYAEVFELCDYARPPAAKEIAFLRLVGAKWVGKEPGARNRKVNPKHEI